MKLNKVKNMWRTLSVIALLGSTLCTSCISEDINRNPLLPTKEDEKMDGVIYGAYLPNLEKSVIPIGTASESTEPVNRYPVTPGRDTCLTETTNSTAARISPTISCTKTG